MGLHDLQTNAQTEDPLTQSVQTAQRSTPQSEDRQAALDRLTALILRSRKVGRAPTNGQLIGVYREICDRIRTQLLVQLNHSLDTYELGKPPIRQWATDHLHQASRESLVDELLKQLALEAQRHAPQSPERQHALSQLVEAIRLSGRLIRPHRAKFTPQFYQLLYDEAVNQTLTYVCRRIDTYDPQRGKAQKFMNWVNFRLDKVLIECRQSFSDRQTQELPDLNNLEQLPQPETTPSLADEVREYIAADPEHLFRQTHIRHRPDANFQTIALARFAETSWEDLSAQLAIKVPTLSCFFQRCCQKFAPLFQSQFQHP